MNASRSVRACADQCCLANHCRSGLVARLISSRNHHPRTTCHTPSPIRQRRRVPALQCCKCLQHEMKDDMRSGNEHAHVPNDIKQFLKTLTLVASASNLTKKNCFHGSFARKPNQCTIELMRGGYLCIQATTIREQRSTVTTPTAVTSVTAYPGCV